MLSTRPSRKSCFATHHTPTVSSVDAQRCCKPAFSSFGHNTLDTLIWIPCGPWHVVDFGKKLKPKSEVTLRLILLSRQTRRCRGACTARCSSRCCPRRASALSAPARVHHDENCADAARQSDAAAEQQYSRWDAPGAGASWRSALECYTPHVCTAAWARGRRAALALPNRIVVFATPAPACQVGAHAADDFERWWPKVWCDCQARDCVGLHGAATRAAARGRREHR